MEDLNLVDRLGIVKAKMADLVDLHGELVEQLKKEFLQQGVRELEGEFFRATFSVGERIQLDSTKASQMLPRDRFPEVYNSKLTETVRVGARTGSRGTS